MMFETSNGKCFNSISLEHLKSRFGLSHSEYSMCISYNDKLYVHAGYDDLDTCKIKAIQFSKRYQTNVMIYYFERPTADEWCQELIEEICVSDNHKLNECANETKETKFVESDSTIKNTTQKYLDFLKNSN